MGLQHTLPFDFLRDIFSESLLNKYYLIIFSVIVSTIFYIVYFSVNVRFFYPNRGRLEPSNIYIRNSFTNDGHFNNTLNRTNRGGNASRNPPGEEALNVEIRNRRNEGSNQFEIGPDDEISFTSTLSPEEVAAEVERRRKTKYKPLDVNAPTRQIEEFLCFRDNDCLDENEDNFTSAMNLANVTGQNGDPKAHGLGGFDPTGKTNDELLRMVKRTRQEEIRQKLEKEMTEEDKVRESIIRQQQLQKIYSLLNENKDAFGQVTYCDVMKQMELYQARKN